MMRKLWTRVALAFLLVTLAAVISFMLVVNRAVETQFQGYVRQENIVKAADRVLAPLEEHYAQYGSWEGAGSLLPGHGGNRPEGTEHGGGNQQGGVRYTIIDVTKTVVFASDTDTVGQIASDELLSEAVPILDNENIVGWVYAETPGGAGLDEAQSQFVEELRLTSYLIALISVVLALLIGIAVSHVLTRPLFALAGAAEAVTEGQLGEKVDIKPGQAAEIKLLAESFNSMSQALAVGEELRQRMTADIAHELRTPLSVIRAQTQAMMDEVQSPTIENIAAVYDQALHLARLVEDLRTLTQAEAGHLPLERQLIHPEKLLNRAMNLFSPLADDAELSLSVERSPELPQVNVDSDRFQQVLANLLANALRHTPSGGNIKMSAKLDEENVLFRVTNSGVTLTPEQAKYVFERLWRADESRSRDRGGSGLGLSITRQIIRLHGGDIRIELGEEQTHFVFTIPTP